MLGELESLTCGMSSLAFQFQGTSSLGVKVLCKSSMINTPYDVPTNTAATCQICIPYVPSVVMTITDDGKIQEQDEYEQRERQVGKARQRVKDIRKQVRRTKRLPWIEVVVVALQAFSSR